MLQLQNETTSGMYARTITRLYSSSGVVGMAAGFSVGSEYSVSYGYDTVGRFNRISWASGGAGDEVTYGHASSSDLLAGLAYTSGTTVSYAYEPNRNLRTTVTGLFGGTAVSEYRYAYDPVGRRTSVANSGLAFQQDAFSTYGYNDRSELTSAGRYLGPDTGDTSNPVGAEARSYFYDPIGNRTQAKEAATQLVYSANQLNQYDLITEDGTGQEPPAYDEDGNLTGIASAGGTTLYRYDAENRLVAVEPDPVDGDRRVLFGYDYMGRRIDKTVYERTLGAWEPTPTAQVLFVYDSWNVIQELDGTGATVRSYVWGLDLSGTLQGAGGIGGLLTMIDAGGSYCYLYDGNGNVGQLVESATGALSAKYEYDPYGNPTKSSGPLATLNRYQFSTKYGDAETGLVYYGYRYYSPELGRWISRDPIAELGGSNLYAFLANQPISSVDVLGQHGLPDPIKEALYNLIVRIGNLAPGLPQDLLQSYMFRHNAWTYTLTRDEVVKQLDPQTTLTKSAEFMRSIQAGRPFEGTYKLFAVTPLDFSLAQFDVIASVQVSCISRNGNRFSYEASGTAVISDTYDFNVDALKFLGGELGLGPGNNRNWTGEFRTLVGRFIPGTPFLVDSERVEVYEMDAVPLLMFIP